MPVSLWPDRALRLLGLLSVAGGRAVVEVGEIEMIRLVEKR